MKTAKLKELQKTYTLSRESMYKVYGGASGPIDIIHGPITGGFSKGNGQPGGDDGQPGGNDDGSYGG